MRFIAILAVSISARSCLAIYFRQNCQSVHSKNCRFEICINFSITRVRLRSVHVCQRADKADGRHITFFALCQILTQKSSKSYKIVYKSYNAE